MATVRPACSRGGWSEPCCSAWRSTWRSAAWTPWSRSATRASSTPTWSSPAPESSRSRWVFVLAGLAAVFVFISCAVMFCVWIHRANRNARALGARGMEFTPGWAAGWFFVPFANLFKPYQAVREIYQASDPDRDEDDEGALLSWHWSKQPAPAQMKLWWGTWILMNAFGNASLRLSFRDDAASQATGTWLGVAGAVAAVPCTLLVIWLIFEIEDRQARRNAGRSGSAPDRGSAC